MVAVRVGMTTGIFGHTRAWLKSFNSRAVGIIQPARWRHIRGPRSKKKIYRLTSILFGGGIIKPWIVDKCGSIIDFCALLVQF